MSYPIKFTDSDNKNDLIVPDGTGNLQTSLKFPGRNQKGYAIDIAENFLHLLENFASGDLPTNPIEGQLWYKSDTRELLVNDGTGATRTSWKPTGSIEKGTVKPTPSAINLGNLFVDTIEKKVYISTGTFWSLVGPTSTENAGLMTDTIKSIDNNGTQDQLILKSYFGNKVVSIFSYGNSLAGQENTAFTPLKKIDGFETIKPGLNISNSSGYKIWGTAEKAEALVAADGTPIKTVNFLRSDIGNTVDQGFSIRNSSGLTVGSNGQLKLQVLDGGVANIHHSTLNSSMYLSVNDGLGGIRNLVSLSADQKAVGINTITPLRTLDVVGTGRFSGIVEITNDTDSLSLTTGSLKISGGVAIAKKLRVADDVVVDGAINLSKTVAGVAVLPTVSDTLDIGTSSLKFRNVYANKFIGNIDQSNITGIIRASVADKLVVTTQFKIVGDIETIADVGYDGTPTQVQLEAYISPTYITDKTDVADTTKTSSNDDVLLIARQRTGNDITTITFTGSITGTTLTVLTGTGVTKGMLLSGGSIVSGTTIVSGNGTSWTVNYSQMIGSTSITGKITTPILLKTTKKNFAASLSLVPIGAILPYAGEDPPKGYSFCDGSELPKGIYSELLDVIGETYGTASNNYFRLPDLRGRFALGRNNMNDPIDPNGGGALLPAEMGNRVNNSNATSLGSYGGVEQTTLELSQLPLNTTSDGNSYSGTSVTPGESTFYNSSKTISPVYIINPFLTINYIIYHGVTE